MPVPFPPLPPDYFTLMLTRWLIVAWSLIGVGIIAYRLRMWKFIKPHEILLWALTGAAGLILGWIFGQSRHHYWHDDWILPVITAVLSVATAGIVVCLCKIYVDGTRDEKVEWFTITGFSCGLASVCFAVVFPSMGHLSPQPHHRMSCKNNLKQIGLAFHNYHDADGTFPPARNGDHPVSWRVSILPYIEENAIYTVYDRQREWDHPANQKFATHRVQVYTCPAQPFPKDEAGRWFTDYSMLTGAGTVGASASGTRIPDIKDGTSNTIIVVETCGAQIVWTDPRDTDTSQQPAGFNLPGSKRGHSAGWLSSYHFGGAHVLMGDGSVRMLSDRTDAATLKMLSTIAGGEDGDNFE